VLVDWKSSGKTWACRHMCAPLNDNKECSSTKRHEKSKQQKCFDININMSSRIETQRLKSLSKVWREYTVACDK